MTIKLKDVSAEDQGIIKETILYYGQHGRPIWVRQRSILKPYVCGHPYSSHHPDNGGDKIDGFYRYCTCGRCKIFVNAGLFPLSKGGKMLTLEKSEKTTTTPDTSAKVAEHERSLRIGIKVGDFRRVRKTCTDHPFLAGEQIRIIDLIDDIGVIAQGIDRFNITAPLLPSDLEVQ
jgi:hypothetical protein